MKSSFKAVTGESLDSVKDAGYLKELSLSYRYMGIYALVIVILGFFTLFVAFRKAQKWAWWAFLIAVGIAWLWGLVNTIAIVDKMNMLLHIIGLVLFLVGLLLPIKEFFAKEAGEAR